MQYTFKAFGIKDEGSIRFSAANATAMAGIKTLASNNGLFYP